MVNDVCHVVWTKQSELYLVRFVKLSAKIPYKRI